jgi:hypothetical protein
MVQIQIFVVVNVLLRSCFCVCVVYFVWTYCFAQCARTTALTDQWVSVEYSYFQSAWAPLFADRILKPRSNSAHVPDQVAQY